MLRLNPPIPLDTPKGLSDAHVMIDYGSESNILWVCFVRETGECWTWAAKDVRLEKKVTGGVRVEKESTNEVIDNRTFREIDDDNRIDSRVRNDFIEGCVSLGLTKVDAVDRWDRLRKCTRSGTRLNIQDAFNLSNQIENAPRPHRVPPSGVNSEGI